MFSAHRFSIFLTAATLAFAGGIYLLMPAGVIAFDDDFGYLRSVVLTLQEGVPRTDEWLEPWAASLSALSAAIFLLTGSFAAAVFLPQILGGAVTFAALSLLLRHRGASFGASLAIAFLFCTMPTVLWKWAEFTALVVYMPCLVLALWGYDRGRWWQFFLFWAIAVASRQSAVLWLALPLWHVADHVYSRWWGRADRGASQSQQPILPLFGWLVVSMVFLILLSGTMNSTHSQELLTTRVWREGNAVLPIRHCLAGLVVLLVAVGIAALTQAHSRERLARKVTRIRAILAIAALVLAFFLLRFDLLEILSNGWASGGSGAVYVGIAMLLSAAGWARGGFEIRTPYLFAALVAAVGISFRPVLYDYYLIDIFLLGFLAVARRSAPVESSPAADRIARRQQAAIAVLLIAVLVLHGYFALGVKATLDRAYGRIVLAEETMRRGELRPSEIGFAPFGYIGWKLHRYFIGHDGRSDRVIAGFLRYLNGRPVSAHEYGQWQSVTRPMAPGRVIAEGDFAIVFLPTRFSLVRSTEVSERSATPSPGLRDVPRFPLNDEEWRALILARR